MCQRARAIVMSRGGIVVRCGGIHATRHRARPVVYGVANVVVWAARVGAAWEDGRAHAVVEAGPRIVVAARRISASSDDARAVVLLRVWVVVDRGWISAAVGADTITCTWDLRVRVVIIRCREHAACVAAAGVIGVREVAIVGGCRVRASKDDRRTRAVLVRRLRVEAGRSGVGATADDARAIVNLGGRIVVESVRRHAACRRRRWCGRGAVICNRGICHREGG